MRKVSLIFRKTSKKFNSIENVFQMLLPFLEVDMLELPHKSVGILSRLKNIVHVSKLYNQIKHITGHDHYLLWWPFRKTILTIHDIEALRRKKGVRYWLFKKLWFDLPIYNGAIITTISEFTKSELLSLNNYKTPIHVIPNPLALPLSYVPKKFNSVCARILHIGTKANKNLPRLINALEGLACELIIIGQSTDETNKLLRKCCITHQFKTGLTNEEVIKEYYASDLVSFVSTYEGFGLPIIEAQSAGRVVLSSNCCSMPEVGGRGALYVDPFSVQSIRNGIEELILNEKLRAELITFGLENVNRFKPEEIASKYSKLYDSLL